MRLIDLQIIGTELAVRWDDKTETFVPLEILRRRCPCAACQGETDVMGQVHRGPDIPLTAESFRLVRVSPVGGYGLQPVWGDGHSTGIFSFDYLRRIDPQS
ncbi:MAG: DUF971 domain-containing protein [Verrucomicrobia bacterium]|nr:DUF971 domain-containing protein [Verrucomicrobiota bacterium]